MHQRRAVGKLFIRQTHSFEFCSMNAIKEIHQDASSESKPKYKTIS